MKTLTITLDDESYEAAQKTAKAQKTTLSALALHFFSSLKKREPTSEQYSHPLAPELKELFDMADARPRQPGSVGGLNREELYERGISGY